MNSYLKPFFYFFYVQNFFKTKKIYIIFIFYTLGTLVEMMNIGIILPFLNFIFNPDSITEKNTLFFNYEPYSFNNNYHIFYNNYEINI